MGTTTTTKTTKDNWEKEIIMSIFSMVDNDLPGNLDKISQQHSHGMDDY